MASRRHPHERPQARSAVPKAARHRLLISLGAAFLAAALLPQLNPTLRMLTAWSIGTWVLIGLAWTIIAGADPAETRRRAAAEDPGRFAVHLLVLLSAMLSLVAAIALMRERTRVHSGSDALDWFVCIAGVCGAWILNHTSWTLRYAHLYYRDRGEGKGGLAFPGDQPPDDLDFAYFAFTIGACFQTSDVTITSRPIRRAALLHAVQSFAFNTTIIALMLNVVFGLLNG